MGAGTDQDVRAVGRNFLSAWTLMGHEFVEMRNTPAAAQVYRVAVDINPNDYRAWYVLLVDGGRRRWRVVRHGMG